LLRLLYTLTKVAVASLVAGSILAHFGITSAHVLGLTGLTVSQLQQLMQRMIAWALPNVMLGAIVIVPLWFLAFLFRPPRRSE
jgi:hypothetical protein